ncbi:MAG: acyl-CoA dehydrogenase family protein [Thermincolia bacterium]
MQLGLTSQQYVFWDEVRAFVEEKIGPRAGLVDAEGCFPVETLGDLVAQGLMGIPIPQEWGGAGADFVSYILAVEEISRACATTGVILAVHTSVGSMPILYFGTEEQKNKYLRPLAQGRYLGAFALTEPQAGSDASSLRTTAKQEGDYYIVNGSKIFITNGGHADVYVTFVKTDSSQGSKGVTALLVDKDTSGFTIGTVEKKMGLNGSATAELIFEDARVPVKNLLGREGEGFKIAMSLLDGGRIGIGAQGLGIAQAALDLAVDYVRENLDKPLDKHQGVCFKLADLSTRVEAARLLVYRAASARDQGLPCGRAASMAKMYATDTAVKVTAEVLDILGYQGVERENPAQRYFRDAKITQIYEGTNQIQRIVIAKDLLR